MDHVDGFYCTLLGSSNDQALSLDHDALELPFINLAHHYDPITMDEVWDVVKYLPRTGRLVLMVSLGGFIGYVGNHKAWLHALHG